jgi:hypothetical protein
LFKQIVIKFQDMQKQSGILVWLKNLIAIHWVTIIKRAEKEDLISLGQVQAFIQKKTQNLDRVLQVKGKIEMLQRTIELNKTLSS